MINAKTITGFNFTDDFSVDFTNPISEEKLKEELDSFLSVLSSISPIEKTFVKTTPAEFNVFFQSQTSIDKSPAVLSPLELILPDINLPKNNLSDIKFKLFQTEESKQNTEKMPSLVTEKEKITDERTDIKSDLPIIIAEKAEIKKDKTQTPPIIPIERRKPDSEDTSIFNKPKIELPIVVKNTPDIVILSAKDKTPPIIKNSPDFIPKTEKKADENPKIIKESPDFIPKFEKKADENPKIIKDSPDFIPKFEKKADENPKIIKDSPDFIPKTEKKADKNPKIVKDSPDFISPAKGSEKNSSKSHISGIKYAPANDLSAKYEAMQFSVEPKLDSQNTADTTESVARMIKQDFFTESLLNFKKESKGQTNPTVIIAEDKSQIQTSLLPDHLHKINKTVEYTESFAKSEDVKEIKIEQTSQNFNNTTNEKFNPKENTKFSIHNNETGDVFSTILENFSFETKRINAEISGELSTKKDLIFKQIEQPIIELASTAETSNDPQMVKLRLRPAELGEITVKLEKNAEGKLDVQFQTENEAVGDVLADSFEQLKNSLQDSGWQVGELKTTDSKTLSDGFNHSGGNSQKEEHFETQSNKHLSSEETSENQEDSEYINPNRIVNLRA